MKKKEQETNLVKLMNKSNKMSNAAYIIAMLSILISFVSFILSLQ